jgi:hypothetical protein
VKFDHLRKVTNPGDSRPCLPNPARVPKAKASVCSLLAGWNRSAEFELALADWAEFGLSRFSASRGLDELERTEMVSVGRMPGWSPIVTIVNAPRRTDGVAGRA